MSWSTRAPIVCALGSRLSVVCTPRFRFLTRLKSTRCPHLPYKKAKR